MYAYPFSLSASLAVKHKLSIAALLLLAMMAEYWGGGLKETGTKTELFRQRSKEVTGQ